jgi:RimJ/RimL family protein N-acetyltransferase
VELAPPAAGRSRVRLDPLRVADAAEMVGVLADPGLYTVIGGGPPTLDELTEQYRRQVVGRSADGREVWLNWVVRAGGAAVGYVQATVHEGDRAVVAWVIGRPWQGQGYATEAARQLLALLAARGVTRIEAYIAPGHLASERVAAHVGLTATGHLDPDGEQLWSAAPAD